MCGPFCLKQEFSLGGSQCSLLSKAIMTTVKKSACKGVNLEKKSLMPFSLFQVNFSQFVMFLNRTIHPSAFLPGYTEGPSHGFQRQRKTCLLATHIRRLIRVKITYLIYIGQSLTIRGLLFIFCLLDYSKIFGSFVLTRNIFLDVYPFHLLS